VSRVQETVGGVPGWSIEYGGESFARFYRSLPECEQAVLTAALEHVLRVHGIDICAGEWGKPLGHGLYEFRVRRSLDAILTAAGLDPRSLSGADRSVLIRVFCTFHGDRIVVLHHGYDKKRDPSLKRQQKEIAKARKIHEAWRRDRRR
jgi:hypothetical protein